MARRNEAAPQMRLHRKSGHARVRIGGREHWLGPWGSQEAKERYRRLVAEWLGKANDAGAPCRIGVTVAHAVEKYAGHAVTYYRRADGSQTHEAENMREAIKPLRRLYGLEPIGDFSADKLRVLRADMLARGLARTTINARVNRIRRFFRWCASHRLCPPSVVHELELVEPLMPGRSQAREAPGIGPVDPAIVRDTLPHLPHRVALGVELLLLTGMRLGELLQMRYGELHDVGDGLIEYRPGHHKTVHKGRVRSVQFGPNASRLVREHAHGDVAGDGRVFPFDRRVFRQHITRACRRHGMPPWTPLQLRHTAATEIRKRFSLEAAQAVLGHAKADVTQRYAERDQELARRVMREVG
jgi:integrase